MAHHHKKHVWTADEDALIVTGRAQTPPLSWDALGKKLHLAPWTVNTHAVAAELVAVPETRVVAPFNPDPEPDDRYRPPYPAGHPVTWGALVAGTCLEGERYSG